MSHLDILSLRPKPPICLHCKNGLHEQPLRADECCACPCHWPQVCEMAVAA